MLGGLTCCSALSEREKYPDSVLPLLPGLRNVCSSISFFLSLRRRASFCLMVCVSSGLWLRGCSDEASANGVGSSSDGAVLDWDREQRSWLEPWLPDSEKVRHFPAIKQKVPKWPGQLLTVCLPPVPQLSSVYHIKH